MKLLLSRPLASLSIALSKHAQQLVINKGRLKRNSKASRNRQKTNKDPEISKMINIATIPNNNDLASTIKPKESAKEIESNKLLDQSDSDKQITISKQRKSVTKANNETFRDSFNCSKEESLEDYNQIEPIKAVRVDSIRTKTHKNNMSTDMRVVSRQEMFQYQQNYFSQSKNEPIVPYSRPTRNLRIKVRHEKSTVNSTMCGTKVNSRSKKIDSSQNASTAHHSSSISYTNLRNQNNTY